MQIICTITLGVIVPGGLLHDYVVWRPQYWVSCGRKIREVIAVSKLLGSVMPGELLKGDILDPMGISQYRLAKEIGVSAQRIGQIVLGKRSITADIDCVCAGSSA